MRCRSASRRTFFAVASVGFCAGALAGCSNARDADTAAPAELTTAAVNSGSAAGGRPNWPASCNLSEPVDQTIKIDSAVYGEADVVSVHFTPCTLDQPNPNAIIYLLHGAGADQTQWPDVDAFTAADAAVLDGTMPPSVLVAPNAPRAYLCCVCGADLLTHLLDEVEPAIERLAPVDPARRAIGGISRGGGLALAVAGLAPTEFLAVGAHSSIAASDETLAAIATAHLPTRFDVGDHDSLRPASERMAATIEAGGGSAELDVSTGGHDRDYWRSQATAYIAFYAAHLR